MTDRIIQKGEQEFAFFAFSPDGQNLKTESPAG
nr:MAG TPA: hypothetical protein [Caudoviricetes sp.]